LHAWRSKKRSFDQKNKTEKKEEVSCLIRKRGERPPPNTGRTNRMEKAKKKRIVNS